MTHTPREKLVWNDELIEILGRPNFTCGQEAQLMRDAGYVGNLPRKAEAEQAAVIFWLLNIYMEVGPERWRDVASDQINEWVSKVQNQEAVS